MDAPAAGAAPAESSTSPQAKGPSPAGSSPAGAPKPAAPSSSVGVAQRAYHPDDVRRAAGRLHVDIEWYLTQQVMPPIARVCEPIEGTSAARIAEVLGLDSKRFARLDPYSRDEDVGFVPRSQLPDEERFKTAELLIVKCLRCNTEAPADDAHGAGG